MTKWRLALASKCVCFSRWAWWQQSGVVFKLVCNNSKYEVGDSRVTLVSHEQQVPAAPIEVTQAPTPWDLIRFSRGFHNKLFPGKFADIELDLAYILASTIILLGKGNEGEDNFVKTSLPRYWQLLYLRPPQVPTPVEAFLTANSDWGLLCKQKGNGGKLFSIILLADHNVPKVFAAVGSFLTAKSDCNGTSCSAGQQQPIFGGSVVFVGTQKNTKVTS